MAYLYRLVTALVLLCASASASAGWRYLATDACTTAATASNNMLAAFRRTENGVRYDYVLTSTNESNGRLDGTRSETTLSTGVTVDKGAWSYVLLNCSGSQEDADCKAVADALTFIRAPLVHYGSVGLTACYAGYVISGTGGASGGGQSELYGPFKCSGVSAVPCSAVPKPSSIVVTCKQGEYPGEVNGVQVCVPPSSSIDAPKTTTATPPAGSASGTAAPPIPNSPAGTRSESEQTTCTGTSCTTTTTYRDVNGAITGTRATDTPKSSYCAENPKAPGCESEKSSFGGDCSSGFTYSGDAIQGAIAQEVYRQNCLMNKQTEEATVYNTEKAKTGDQTGTLPGNQTVSIGPADFDSTDAIGGAACIADRTVVVWGKTIVIGFSVVCPVMVYLKNILLALSYLTAAGIVIGRRS